MIGGDYCNTEVPADLLPGDIQKLTAHEMDVLWRIFQEIGRTWKCSRTDSHNIRSDWLEFIHAKTNFPPSYVGEYSNAVSCVSEMMLMYGEKEAFQKLLLDHGMRDPKAPPLTHIAHTKVYVVNEFIRVQVAKEGFKAWQGSNYKGYVGGSRFNRKPRARIGIVPVPGPAPVSEPEKDPGKVPGGEVEGV